MNQRHLRFKNKPVLALTALFVAVTYSQAASAQELGKQSAARATARKTQDQLPEMPRPELASFSDDQEHQSSDEGSTSSTGVAPNNFGLAR